MKDMALWQEADWIAAIAVIVLAVFLVGWRVVVALILRRRSPRS